MGTLRYYVRALCIEERGLAIRFHNTDTHKVSGSDAEIFSPILRKTFGEKFRISLWILIFKFISLLDPRILQSHDVKFQKRIRRIMRYDTRAQFYFRTVSMFADEQDHAVQ